MARVLRQDMEQYWAETDALICSLWRLCRFFDPDYGQYGKIGDFADAYDAFRQEAKDCWHTPKNLEEILTLSNLHPISWNERKYHHWHDVAREACSLSHQLIGEWATIPDSGDSNGEQHLFEVAERVFKGLRFECDSIHRIGVELVHERNRAIAMLPATVASETVVTGAAQAKIEARPEGDGEKIGATRRRQRTPRGGTRAKFVAALTAHHGYENGSIGNQEPITVEALAKAAGISTGSVSTNFNAEFKGHGGYVASCRRGDTLVRQLKLMNGEIRAHVFLQDANQVADESGDERDE